ncbi:MAG TPA: acetyl-CoA carboxylase biotin carboxyl carrier protein [Polyangiaceae bacterium]|jgi:acetyl-CoA carboxylase biotin carboxyl carrier protein|nr:acetyl-CoA carboxylase biotin carboxyl carrier protein [Polyangiaceae bacterium]
MSLDLEQLSALFELLAEKDIAEFEHEEGGIRIRVARGVRALATPPAMQAPLPTASASDGGIADGVAGDYVDITSPFVGSFYRSPSPDSPAFVEAGSVVRSGQTLCIIEAMKLMNEIESECAGTVTEIFAQNGKSVEYGQKLFRIKKA